VQDMYNGVKAMIKREKELWDKSHKSDLFKVR
jgi:hypothetical protein